ncbi:hypothetical protein PoB_000536600 [Plakobranchus ocellatus]|uniref:Uncharacterized protein n=1 Tax=Plakobranchus ocellatus TaxID=259542 RepID=A0AAV3XV45_9GAST|nr:hypothetical protein PoB_000536600 [Plakobranchus ocellatus]
MGRPSEDSERALVVPAESELSRETSKVRIWARAIHLIGRRLTEEAISCQDENVEKVRASTRTKTKKESRLRVDRVNLAAARQTLKSFWWPPERLQNAFGSRHRDSRVFLAAAILTLESFWGRVTLACYTGVLLEHKTARVPR